MQSGKYRSRGTLQKPSRVRDELGEWVDGWADVTDVWSRIRPVSSRAWMAAAQEQREVTAEIYIRPRSDVAGGWRFLRGDTVYEIVAPLFDAERNELKLMCKTVKSHG
ncbi:phage head closure protein [Pseudomonas tussilaginis]|uniref:phage head closure protein n=1 Tax=Pseudomonas putida TaxID=303 RepID=UPI0023636DCB|nr:phage head closure protein [Pseudomonas putida]MDD1979003.1 phage head closure protein [Pseudomonas putida]